MNNLTSTLVSRAWCTPSKDKWRRADKIKVNFDVAEIEERQVGSPWKPIAVITKDGVHFCTAIEAY
jgi:hypothetical protein